MVRYIEAPKGMMFALTEFGLEHSHVRGKYEAGSVHKTRYEKKVPTAWIEKGYVQIIRKEVYDED